MIPYCDTPWQSIAAALVGGVAGGLVGATLGLDALGVVLLAGTLGGAGDLLAHAVRRDAQFEAALETVGVVAR